MKWGVRRYQNEDGSLTPEGERRYYKDAKGNYKKRTAAEISRYDTIQRLNREGQQELQNINLATSYEDFDKRMNKRWYHDEKIKDLKNQYNDIEFKEYE